MRALTLPMLVLWCAACSADPPAPMCEVRTSLIDHLAWRQVPPDHDPFAVALERCGDERMRAEDFSGEMSYTIETRSCSWGTVEQALPFAIAAGDSLNFRLWYFSQDKFDVAEATILVAVGDEPLWTALVPLPSSTGALLLATLEAPRDIASGEVLRFHVANHGTNSWNLIEVSQTQLAPCTNSGGT